jgi:hypothetical protein
LWLWRWNIARTVSRHLHYFWLRQKGYTNINCFYFLRSYVKQQIRVHHAV